MALLGCDGFDHYGVIGNLTEGAWAEVTTGGGAITLVTTNPRTGTHHLRFATSSAVRTARRVLGGPKTTVGIACVLYMSQLPSSNAAFVIYDFRDAANAFQVSIVVQSTGTISAYRGTKDGVLLGTSASPAVTAEAYQHIETIVFFSQTVGTVEVRVNGVTVLSLTGQDTVASSLVECSQIGFVCGNSNGAGTAHGVLSDLDDVFWYDETGSFNNSFLGDRRVLTLFPDADTVQADWTAVGAANGFDAIRRTRMATRPISLPACPARLRQSQSSEWKTCRTESAQSAASCLST
jgi:hypothetical protein